MVVFNFTACEWPFNTNTTNDDLFELKLSHNIVRVMPSAEIDLTWNEITVENFKSFKIECLKTNDTKWTPIVNLTDPFQLSYTDTIWDDEDLIYRIGIIDLEDNILWATTAINVPRTTSVLVSEEFATIQPAFNSELTDDGDTIIVNPGIYQETLGIAGKEVLIVSTRGFHSTILQPTFVDSPHARVVNITSGILQGFTIEHGDPSFGAPGGGIFISQNGTVQNCYVAANKSSGVGGGVFITDDGNLYNNIISRNTASSGSGIYITAAHGEIINNTIAGNDIVINGDCSGLILRNNIIYDSFPDIDVSFLSQADTSGIIIDFLLLDSEIGIGSEIIVTDPEFLDYMDFKLSPTSPGIDAGHPGDKYLDRDGSRNDIGAYGGPGGE
ncbi:MAG: right-handed parallel beta-helix repeat-containing protein [Candidatus Neomarinimicrobiota bacterium]